METRWQWLTEAEVVLEKEGLTRTQNGECLRLFLPEAEGIHMEVRPVREPLENWPGRLDNA